MNAHLTGGIYDGATFPLLSHYWDDPPDLIEVFRCPDCDDLHHGNPEDYEALLVWQQERGLDDPIDPELYGLDRVEPTVAHYTLVGLAMPESIEESALAHA